MLFTVSVLYDHEACVLAIVVIMSVSVVSCPALEPEEQVTCLSADEGVYLDLVECPCTLPYVLKDNSSSSRTCLSSGEWSPVDYCQGSYHTSVSHGEDVLCML